MGLVLKDRVRTTSLTTGVGPLDVSNAPPQNCVAFAEIGDGNTTYYTLVNPAGLQWEVGIGTYDADTDTLDRTTILASSTGGAVVNLTSGSKTVFVGIPASVIADLIAAAATAIAIGDVTGLTAALAAKMDDSQATAFGLSVLGAADAPATHTLLGLVIGTHVQAYDAELAALAGLTSAANKLPYFTGAGTAGLADLTAFARTLLDDADAAAMLMTIGAAPLASPALTGTPSAPTAAGATNTTQLATTAFVQAAIATLINSAPGALDTLNELATALGNDPNFATTVTNSLAGKAATGLATASGLTMTTAKLLGRTTGGTGAVEELSAATAKTLLGLVIGTDVQAYDAELAALAGLTSAANKLPYFTGAGTAALADFSAFARTLLDDADAAAMKATLGIGGSDWTQIGSTINTTSGTSATFTSIPTTYADLMLVAEGVSHNNGSNASFRLEMSDDGTNWTSPLSISDVAVAAAATQYGALLISGYKNPAGVSLGQLTNLTANRTSAAVAGAHAWRIAAGIQALRVSPSAGSFDAGTLKLFGK